MLIATLIFVLTYAFIAAERIHKTLVALAGAMAMILINIIDQQEAFQAIDFNVIFLLAGMMVIADILRRTGVFQRAAIISAKLARGNPLLVLVYLSIATALLSAFLPNVTTVILIAPVTLFVAARLQVSPLPFLTSEIIASNIGGTATLIGDPPNTMIGSAAGLDFMSFIYNLAPVAIFTLVVFLALAWLLFGRELKATPEVRASIMAIDETEMITDAPLLRKSLLILGLTMIGFVLHGALGYEPATIALLGATALMIIARQHPQDVLKEVEWSTLFFFVGLFILVGGVVKVGLIDLVAQGTLNLTQGNLTLTTLLLLWFSGLASGIVDNIPYTATMIPVVMELGEHMPAIPLWWALALGACFGGNLTIIAASANVIVGNIAEQGGHRISFGTFLKYGMVATAMSLALSTAYLWLRYLL